ncbi:MAG: 1-acyl-sn-glycerol-3-phosphate acyltransferase [Gammaproteobacteria bacterium]|nr:1-acyl-sn-glycerol-3-phosphate acyltransferase [Gammaproteobacteria bacterium]
MPTESRANVRERLRPVIGAATFVLMLAALLLCSIGLLPMSLMKALLPLPAMSGACTRALVWIAGVPWVGANRLIYRLLHGPQRGMVLDVALDRRKSWLVISNHRSWADILLLVDALWLRAPFPRFFLKRELIWIPIIGFVCWAMDMPFMRRHSRAEVAASKDPAREDLEVTHRVCRRYRGIPVTVINFLEGTRFSEAKRRARGSSFTHLLRPKCGGLAFALAAMGDQFDGLVDVTIAYRPTRRSLLWSFLCGEQTGAAVRLRVRKLPADLIDGDYQGDAEFRGRFQAWVNRLWHDKDAELAVLYAAQAPLEQLRSGHSAA